MAASYYRNLQDPVASMDVLNSLVPCCAITPLIQLKSNSQGAQQQVMFHASLLTLAAIIPFPKISMLRMAFVSAFFLNRLHETVHGTAFHSKQIKNFVAQCFGFVTL
jgi:hypothetical protein